MSACRDFIFLRSIPDEDDFNWYRIKSLSNPESGAILTAALNVDNTCTSAEFKVILFDRLGIAQMTVFALRTPKKTRLRSQTSQPSRKEA